MLILIVITLERMCANKLVLNKYGHHYYVICGSIYEQKIFEILMVAYKHLFFATIPIMILESLH